LEAITRGERRPEKVQITELPMIMWQDYMEEELMENTDAKKTGDHRTRHPVENKKIVKNCISRKKTKKEKERRRYKKGRGSRRL